MFKPYYTLPPTDTILFKKIEEKTFCEFLTYFPVTRESMLASADELEFKFW